MLFSTLLTNPLIFLIYIVSLLIAITIHEFSHAFVADYLGDPTPRLQGRVKLNPLVHLDPYGVLFLLFFGFGWGKPVAFDPFNLKNPRRDAALISLAGPASNIILAVVLSIIARIIPAISAFITPVIIINVTLAIFNLLPIHPLDGFKIVGGFLSRDQARNWYDLERYGMIFLLLLIIPLGRTSLLDLIMSPIVSAVLSILLPPSAGIL